MPPVAVKPLAHENLRRLFDPDQIPFETSDKSTECAEAVLGQDRAKEALEFGLAMKQDGYHIYVAGPPRTGKTYLVKTYLERLAAELPPPPDWVYVHNFKNPDQPRILRLENGGAKAFARQMSRLVEGLKAKIPELFEGDEYAGRKEGLAAEFKKKRTDLFQDLDKQARKEGYVLRFEPTGIMVAPADEDGQPLAEERIREMSENEREGLREKSDMIQGKVTETLRTLNNMEKGLNQQVKALDSEMVHFAVGHLFEELFDKYAEQSEVLIYLEQVHDDVTENYELFIKKQSPAVPGMPVDEPDFRQYDVNVFVDNSEREGAPVILEDHPIFANLFGRMERQARMGALFTDFTMLKPGALHQANGGFLVVPVLDLLQQWIPWDGLKRALRKGEASVEDAMEQAGFTVTRTMRPEAMPLDLKVILVGDNMLYQLLRTRDPQFTKLFKVLAQMAERMNWEEKEVEDFIRHLCGLCADEKLLPLHRSAGARLIELAAELAGDQERLTLRLSDVANVVRESDFWARREKKKAIHADDVRTAINTRRRRSSMLEEHMRESITRGIINVETEGRAVGQINGLYVLDTGEHMFGQPARITATHGLGKEGVVAVDRESDLSGPFHTKGILIIGGFLRDRFARNGPLALTASLVFEQSYARIDGDSASMAELLALLSRLSGIPLRQDLAITGSVDQWGRAQAIGGVNHKIEGFFRLCEERGLSGSQGVVIPKSNQKHLMLHEDVVDAARQGRFSIYSMETVEEALTLFTGKKAGKLSKAGNYTRGSIFDKVAKELNRLGEMARQLGEKEGGKKSGSTGKCGTCGQ